MESVAKAEALARRLQNDLTTRLTFLNAHNAGLNFIRAANDANGWPMLFISNNGNEAEGQPVVLIRIMNVNMVSKDIFGNNTYAYAPHTLEFAYELGTASANTPIPTLADITTCEFEAINSGVAFLLKEVPNGTQVTEAEIDALAPTITLDNLYWPTKLV
jgi:hypothetical protein